MSHFFAFLRRMKFIRRWGLMRNMEEENIQEHTLEVAFVAHNLACIKNTYFGGQVNAERVAVLAMYHEVSEIFTGDMPTPVKYFDKSMRAMYGQIEQMAQEKMLATLPAPLKPHYEGLLVKPEENELWPLVKAADTISAFMKCAMEKNAGNKEFNEAYDSILKKLHDLNSPEVEKFLELYVPSLSCSLDELNYSIERQDK